jgi:hypothetical protein
MVNRKVKHGVTWVRIVGAGAETKMVCERCGGSAPLALPMLLADVPARLTAMGKLHEDCPVDARRPSPVE